MYRVLVTGANGQLGSWLCNLAAEREEFIFSDITPCQRREEGVSGICNYTPLDITDREAVEQLVRREDIKVIINCAAYTNVDGAEDDKEQAELINSKAVALLAQTMKEVGGLLLHISTDYVFGGNSYNTPCGEDAPENPTGVYGATKLNGERAIREIGGNYIIIRTSWLYSEYGKNFVKTILNLTSERGVASRVSQGKPADLKVVFDQVGTPTYAADLAKAILLILSDYNQFISDLTDLCGGSAPKGYPKSGVYHFSNEGVTSWYDFAKRIADMAQHNYCEIAPCHSNQFPSKVVRPSYSVLDKSKIKEQFAIAIPYWTDSLKSCIEKLKLLQPNI